MADYSVTAASVIASANATTVRGTAGATITAGQTVYLDSSDSLYKLYDADGSGDAKVLKGIALNGADTGQPLAVCTEDPDFTPGMTVAAGAVVVGSDTAGGLMPAADLETGDYATIVGVGIGSNKIALKIVASGVAAA